MTHKEWRVTYEVRIGTDKIAVWRSAESPKYTLKRNAWREFTKRRDMPNSYRNVVLQERTVTVGAWAESAAHVLCTKIESARS